MAITNSIREKFERVYGESIKSFSDREVHNDCSIRSEGTYSHERREIRADEADRENRRILRSW